MKTRDSGDTKPSVMSELLMSRVTAAVGWLSSTTEKLTVCPASEVINCEGWLERDTCGTLE